MRPAPHNFLRSPRRKAAATIFSR